MSLRKDIYNSNNNLLGILISDAGADIEATQLSTVSLDGTGSTSSLGSITAYKWDVITVNGFVIDSPTASISTISGNFIIGEHTIKLTVWDDLGNVSSDIIKLIFTESGKLVITSSTPIKSPSGFSASGTLNFSEGEANEVIGLEFNIYTYGYDHSATFDGSIVTNPLDSAHSTRIGSVTLDGNGEFESNYMGIYENLTSSFDCEVIITSRSSSYNLPSVDRTNINFF